MNKQLLRFLSEVSSLVLGGVIVGCGILAWQHDTKNLAGLAVVAGMLIGLRGGLWVAEREP